MGDPKPLHAAVADETSRALVQLNAADKKFNAIWQRMGYDAVQVQKPVKQRAKRRK